MSKSDLSDFKLNGRSVTLDDIEPCKFRAMRYLDSLPNGQLITASQLLSFSKIKQGTHSDVTRHLDSYRIGGKGIGPIYYGSKKTIKALRERLDAAIKSRR